MRQSSWLGVSLALVVAGCGGSVGSGSAGLGGSAGSEAGVGGGTGGVVGGGGVGGSLGGGGGGPGGSGGSGGTSACVLPSTGDVSGQYFFVFSLVLAPQKPVVFSANVTAIAVPSGGMNLKLTLVPLAAADRKTPVGAQVDLSPSIGADGTLDAALPPIDIPAAANPLTPSDVTVEVSSLNGQFCQPGGFYCGTVAGQVTKPIPLDLKGSTWTLTKVSGPSDYPEPPPIDCNHTPADPL